MSYFNDLDYKTWKFNKTAGNNEKLSKKDFEAQYKCLVEEVNEIGEGLETNNLEEVLDGVVDVLVVATGLAHKLEAFGINVGEAVNRITENNLSKFPEYTKKEALETIEMYSKKGELVHSYEKYGRLVTVDLNGKIRKPASFVSVDLSDLVGGRQLNDN